MGWDHEDERRHRHGPVAEVHAGGGLHVGALRRRHQLAQGVEVGLGNRPVAGGLGDRPFGQAHALLVAPPQGDPSVVAHPSLLGRDGADRHPGLADGRHDRREVAAVELHHRDDPVVDLHPEGGHGHRLHIPGDLFGALLGAGEDVQLLGPADVVDDDAGRVHGGQPAELLLDAGELSVVHGGVTVPMASTESTWAGPAFRNAYGITCQPTVNGHSIARSGYSQMVPATYSPSRVLAATIDIC